MRNQRWAVILMVIVLGGCEPGPFLEPREETSPDLTGQEARDESVVSGARDGLDSLLAASGTQRVAAPPALSINEVGLYTDSNQLGWVELRNNTTTSLQLADYALRARGVDASKSPPETRVMLFPLRAQLLTPGAYIVVAGTASPSDNFDSPQSMWLNESGMAPSWSSDRFVEIVHLGTSKTVDFIRFGASTQSPLSSGEWVGTNVQVPPDKNSAAFSFARTPGTEDTHSANDWSSRNYPTPAGPNDVPENQKDTDNDGIPDSAEVLGGRFAGLDLYAMGARVGPRDIFVEVDYMLSDDPGLLPRKEALAKVVAVFAKHGISVHFDAGNLVTPRFDPAKYNLGQDKPTLPFSMSISLKDKRTATSVNKLKATFTDFARRAIFHYCVFGSTQVPDGQEDASGGKAELVGNDLLITLGLWGLNTQTPAKTNQLINTQASTLMHELGHNLGLRHGGGEDDNHKPNYLSTMNYLYQTRGVGPTRGASAGDRYYQARKFKNYTSREQLENSEFTTTFIIDYSDGSSSSINEDAVDEAAGLGRSPRTFVDYDNDGIQRTPRFDVNDDKSLKVLTDYNDWGNLKLAFGGQGISTLSRKTASPPAPSFVHDLQPEADEEPLDDF